MVVGAIIHMCLWMQLDKPPAPRTQHLLFIQMWLGAASRLFLCVRPEFASFAPVMHLTHRHVCTHLTAMPW